MRHKSKFGRIKESLAHLMYEIANDDNIPPEMGLSILVTLDLAITANDYAYLLTAEYPQDINSKKVRLKSFTDWLEEIE